MVEKTARRLIAALCMGALSLGAWGAMTAEQAYTAIGHQRTLFEPGSLAEGEALRRLFILTDEGVVLKAQGMRAHGANDAAALRDIQQRYQALLAALKAEAIPPAIAPARDLIVGAVEMHGRFFASRPAGELRFARADLGAAADVTGASRRLLDAYGIVMRAYPAATARQKQAFYDHLCALDFL